MTVKVLAAGEHRVERTEVRVVGVVVAGNDIGGEPDLEPERRLPEPVGDLAADAPGGHVAAGEGAGPEGALEVPGPGAGVAEEAAADGVDHLAADALVEHRGAIAEAEMPLFRRLGLGSVLGYFAAGVLVGPAGLALFTDAAAILHFSELGVVMFLFVIGLELRPPKLWAMRGQIFGAGPRPSVDCDGRLPRRGDADASGGMSLEAHEVAIGRMR